VKVTVVPAQITSVEDTIAGSLTLNQALLLITPILLSGLLFIFLPPLMHGSLYKYLLIIVISLLFVVLAIRVKGTLLIFWLIIRLRYNLRPRFFIYNKNDMHMRLLNTPDLIGDLSAIKPSFTESIPRNLHISPSERIQLDQFIHNPEISMRFQPGKRGGIDVLIAEVER
jgi:hypothetical protein